jgi:hypothetical protein
MIPGVAAAVRSDPNAVPVCVRHLGGRLQREPRLPGSTGPSQREQADPLLREQAADIRQLPLPAEERRRRHRQIRPAETRGLWGLSSAELIARRLHSGRAGKALRLVRSEGLVLVENPPLELLEPAARLEPELLLQDSACPLVRLECFCLPVRAIEREHQHSVQALVQRVADDEPFDLAHEVRRLPSLDAGLQLRLERPHVKVVEPETLGPDERGVAELGERLPAPKRQRGLDRVVSGPALSRTLKKALETFEVELALADTQLVPTTARDQPLLAERLAKAEMQFLTIFAAVGGDRSPHSSSISRSVGTVLLRCRSSRASSARCCRAPKPRCTAPSSTSSGPRMRYSIASLHRAR